VQDHNHKQRQKVERDTKQDDCTRIRPNVKIEVIFNSFANKPGAQDVRKRKDKENAKKREDLFLKNSESCSIFVYPLLSV